jgi:hypothetical protein
MTQSTPPKSGPHDEHPAGLGADGLGDDAGAVGRGQYGVAEEPPEFEAVDLTETPQDPGEKFRDAARDKEVRETGEDLG